MRWGRRRDRFEDRTCRECGTTWRVDRRAAKLRRPGRWRSGFSLADLRGAEQRIPSDQVMGDLLDSMHRRAASADDERTIIAAVRRCPRCGSTRCTKRPVHPG